MKTSNRWVVLVAVGVTAIGATGCGALAELIHPKESPSKQAAAESAKEAQKVNGFRQAIATSSCDTLFETYQKHEGEMGNYDADGAKDTRVALARKFVECKKTDELFSCLGNKIGPRNFDAAQKEGVDVVSALKSYLAESHPKGVFQSAKCSGEDGYSSREVFDWARARSESLCSEFEGAMDGADPLARGTITAGYLVDKSCEGASERVLPGLQADAPWAIESTCTYLGKYGNASHISDLETVAHAHNDQVIEDGRVIVPVHDVCLQAAAKLKLRKDAPGTSSAKSGARN